MKHAALRAYFATCLLLVCTSLVYSGQDEFAKLVHAASDSAGQGNYSKALSEIQAAIALNTADPQGWYELGLLQGQIGDFVAAEAAFRHSLELKPQFAEAHYNLGLALIANPQAKVDWPAAIAEFRAALENQPDYAEARNLLGAGLTNSGDAAAAIVELRRAVLLKPTLAEAHFNLAIALEQTDHLEDAAKEYRAAVSARGTYPEATTALGKLLFRMGKTADAEQELDKAVSLNPDLGDAHYVLGRVLQASGQSGQAATEFDIAKALGQRLPDSMQSSRLSNQALESAARGDLKGATDLLHRAIALNPDYGIPHYNLGLILADQGDLGGAAQELTKAISLLPGQAKPWYQLGRVLAQTGDKQTAFLALSWATRLAPSDTAIRNELASFQSADKSELRSENPASLAPPQSVGAASDTASDHIAFARQLIARGDLMGGAGELLRALILQPANLDARQILADTYERLGDRPRAILEYQKILRESPDDTDSRLALGRIFLAEGDARNALEQFLTVQKAQPDSVAVRSALQQAQKALRND